MNHGLILRKIHRIVGFKQSAWLKTYIDLNSDMRRAAKNEFVGKTMESVRKRANIKLVIKWTGRYGTEALIAKPNFKAGSIFDEHLVAIKLGQVRVLLNKPFYIGFCVLDLSKTCVYEFHYNFMRNILGNDCKILYADTDSLIYEIKDQFRA